MHKHCHQCGCEKSIFEFPVLRARRDGRRPCCRTCHNLNGNRARARRALAPGNHTSQDVYQQYQRQHGRCYWCKRILNEYHVDHIYPLSRGGTNWPENICCACASCNLHKHAQLPEVFLARISSEGGILYA